MESGMIPAGEDQAGEGKRTASSPVQAASPEAQEEAPLQKEESRHPEGASEPSRTEWQRRRLWVVLVPFVLVGALLMLGFSPLSRLAVHWLPRASGGPPPVVTGSQRANTSAV